MVVDTSALARELRRRRLGRPALMRSLAASSGTTWLPGELSQVPAPLLVLAAMSLARTSRWAPPPGSAALHRPSKSATVRS